MARWVLKAAVQRAIGAMPARHRLNEFMQERVTGSVRLSDDDFAKHLGWERRHLDWVRRFAPQTAGRPWTAVEVGAGRHPILPVAFRLCGAGRVVTADVAPLMRTRRVLDTLRAFVAARDDGRLADLLPEAGDVDRLRDALGKDWDADDPRPLLAEFGIDYVVGPDVLATLADGSADWVGSNGVLEYVDEPHLTALLGHCRRLLADGGVTTHHVDLRDEFSHADPSITHYNFLRFGEATWRAIRNPLIPLNRLRWPDYVDAVGRAGLAIVDEHLMRGDPADLRSVPLAEQFKRYAFDELLVGQAWFAAGVTPA